MTVLRNYLKCFDLSVVLGSRLARQTSVLFSSQILLLGMAVLTGVINSRYLGPAGYGIYSFVSAVIAFLAIFFGFGLTSAGARIIALASNKKEECEIAGSLIIAGLFIALVFSATVFMSSFFIDRLFRTNINRILMLISLISGVLPFQLVIDQLYRGCNRINELAFFDLFPRVWYLASVLIVILFSSLTPLTALFLSLGGILIACLIAVKRLHPVFRNTKENLQLLLKETKEYGFHVYLGRIADTSTYKLDNMFIASFVNTTYVGFYTLATTLVSPMSKLSSSMSISLFKDFTKAERIHNIVIMFNLAWLLFCIVFLGLLGKLIVVTLFSEKFLPMVPLILPLAIAGFFQAMYTPFNMFLAAHRKGKELRFIAFTEAIFNLIGNFILIYYYGAMGAAVASAIAKGIELALNLHFYIRAIK